jgi:hypothetical protein
LLDEELLDEDLLDEELLEEDLFDDVEARGAGLLSGFTTASFPSSVLPPRPSRLPSNVRPLWLAWLSWPCALVFFLFWATTGAASKAAAMKTMAFMASPFGDHCPCVRS